MTLKIGIAAIALTLSTASASAFADIKIGFVSSLTGPTASLGLPLVHGLQAARTYRSEVAGHKITVIQYDDASDPTTATRNARKLVNEDKVDAILGGTGTPAALAIAAVAHETKTPLLALSAANLKGEPGSWMLTVPQPGELMVEALVEHMKKNGNIKKVGYIGFSDPWGDLVYAALKANLAGTDIDVVTNERFARVDTSVTGQTLKILAARPDAVVTGTSGTPGTLPFLTLRERGYKGLLYGLHGLINPDFVRVGGTAVEGVIVPAGPVVVADQLPDSNPSKQLTLEFRKAYEKANGEPPSGAISAYAFDAWLLVTDAAARAVKNAEPGTPEFRIALREALVSTKELAGTHGVYNYTPDSRFGSDERSRILVTLKNGQWKILD